MVFMIFGEFILKILIKYLILNILGVIIINIMFSIFSVIFFEVFLSFIGFGFLVLVVFFGVLVNDGYKIL